MTNKVRNIALLTSGGDAPGMNAAIRAVVRKGIYHGLNVFGIKKGYEGLIHGEFIEMGVGAVADIIHRGGTMLMTARSEEMRTPEGQKNAAEQLRYRDIDALIVIGGDGSFRGAQTISAQGIPVVGIPATIDSDIPGTDLTIGFDTAVNTVVESVSKIRDTATSHERTFLVEVMGRKSGNIALQAGIACGAESILIPEIPFDLGEVTARLERGHLRGKHHSIILVAEGAGSTWDIAKELRERTGFETRVTILGHIQRGGSPTATDVVIASAMGAKAVEVLCEGQTDVMIAYVNHEVKALPMETAYGEHRSIDENLYKLASQLAI